MPLKVLDSCKTCLVTHAHVDHAYFGHELYIATDESLLLKRKRLGKDIPARAVKQDETFKCGNTWVSFPPPEHILGSAQVRIETNQSVTVISGEYKRASDATCTPFEGFGKK